MTAIKLALLGLLLAVAIVFPHLFGNATVTLVAFFALLYATMASAWNILAGYTGYYSLGHAAFFGIGGYAMAILCQDYTIQGGYGAFYLLPVCGLIAAAFAVPLGIITLRTRRHVFVVLTIAMLFIGQLLAFNLLGLTSGSNGMILPLPPWIGAAYNIPFYYTALALLVLTMSTSFWIRRSRFGLSLMAIRDDEDRAAGLGINTWLHKLIAFVVPAFFLGMVGATYFYFQGQIEPQFAFNPLDDLAMALMSFSGGLGTVLGPVLGGLLIEGAQQYFALTSGVGGNYLILYGALFLAVILLMPRGIIPTIAAIWSSYREKRNDQQASASPGEASNSEALGVAEGTSR